MADNKYEAAEAAIRKLRPENEERRKSVTDRFLDDIGKDRSRIGIWVVKLYVGVVGSAAGYLILRGLWYHENIFPDLAELVKIAVVPIVTLVIGFYFGSRSK